MSAGGRSITRRPRGSVCEWRSWFWATEASVVMLSSPTAWQPGGPIWAPASLSWSCRLSDAVLLLLSFSFSFFFFFQNDVVFGGIF
jgi:hypothetical protein